jgi:carboxymethylenebutenolidase
MNEKITTLYDRYKHGGIDRRMFLKELVFAAGGTAAALAILPGLEKGDLIPEEFQQDDPDLVTGFITYQTETGEMKAFQAYPKKGKKFAAVIIVHENKGLVPHIREVAKRMAKEGFLAIAPDALSELGGTPDDITNVGEMFRKLDPAKNTKNFVAAVKYLKTNPLSTGKVGCTGFCWGGAMTNQVAVNAPDLDAAVPYYGSQPAEADVEKIKAPIMAHYAGNDERINAGIPAFEEALKKYKKEYQIFMYPGAAHAFNNDSNPERYNAEAAKLAWGRTVGFFKEKLK